MLTQIAVKRREAKRKGEKERYSHLNAEQGAVNTNNDSFPAVMGYRLGEWHIGTFLWIFFLTSFSWSIYASGIF